MASISIFVFIARALSSAWASGALIVIATALWTVALGAMVLGWWP